MVGGRLDRSRGPFRAGRLQNGAVAEHSVSRQASGVHGNVSNGQFLSRKSSKHSIFVSFQRFSIKVIQIVFLFAFSSFFFSLVHWLSFPSIPRPKDLQPLELRLDTLSCFQLAIYGLDLLRTWDFDVYEGL